MHDKLDQYIPSGLQKYISVHSRQVLEIKPPTFSKPYFMDADQRASKYNTPNMV